MRTSEHTRGLVLLIAAGCAISGTARAEPTCYLDNAGRIVQRQRPGYKEVPCPARNAPGQPPTTVSSPDSTVQRPLSKQGSERAPPATVSPIPVPGVQSYAEVVPVPDRWRIVDALGYPNSRLDPYNRNILKADKPVYRDWFFNLGLLSDSVYENRNIPVTMSSVSPSARAVRSAFPPPYLNGSTATQNPSSARAAPESDAATARGAWGVAVVIF